MYAGDEHDHWDDAGPCPDCGDIDCWHGCAPTSAPLTVDEADAAGVDGTPRTLDAACPNCGDPDCALGCLDCSPPRDPNTTVAFPAIEMRRGEVNRIATYVMARTVMEHRERTGETIERDDQEHLDAEARALLDVLLDRHRIG